MHLTAMRTSSVHQSLVMRLYNCADAESPYPRWRVGVWIMGCRLLEAGPAVIETAKD